MKPAVVIAVDTEEDNWGYYGESGATVKNISLLPLFQERLDRWGARATYLVNWPTLVDEESVRVLGELGKRPDVEIGTHCHVWNTPPHTGAGVEHSMMFRFPVDVLRAKVRSLTRSIQSELGLTPSAFRAGRWSFGENVARALFDEGYRVDTSVTPFMDWSRGGGPDFSEAPHRPYRFHPAAPLLPEPGGSMIEIPTTIGFYGGSQHRAGRWRKRLERGFTARLGVVGALDRTGLLTKRWLSPEKSSAREMIRLAEACVASGVNILVVSLHSCALLPGATPFVADVNDRERFLGTIDAFLAHCSRAGFAFLKLTEAATSWEQAGHSLGVSGAG